MTLAQQFIMWAWLGFLFIQFASAGPTKFDEVYNGVARFMFEIQPVEAPLYDPSVSHEKYSEKRWELDQGLTNDFCNFVYQMADETLWEEKNFYIDDPEAVKKYFESFLSIVEPWGASYSLLLERNKETPPMTVEFINVAVKVWNEAVAESEKIAPPQDRYTEKEIIHGLTTLKVIMGAAKAIVEKSPTGLYMKWDSVTIDNKTIGQRAAIVLANFRYSGYGWVAELAVKILDKIKSFPDTKPELTHDNLNQHLDHPQELIDRVK